MQTWLQCQTSSVISGKRKNHQKPSRFRRTNRLGISALSSGRSRVCEKFTAFTDLPIVSLPLLGPVPVDLGRHDLSWVKVTFCVSIRRTPFTAISPSNRATGMRTRWRGERRLELPGCRPRGHIAGLNSGPAAETRLFSEPATSHRHYAFVDPQHPTKSCCARSLVSAGAVVADP